MNAKKMWQRGMTLVELMIVVAIVAALAAVVIGSMTSLTTGEDVKKDAEASVRQYASEMHLKVDGMSCGDRANSKGMVYCSLRSGAQTIPLSCIGMYKFGHGCKVATLTAPGPGDPQ